MSLITLHKCPVIGCKFNKRPVKSDISQFKRHLRYDHGYKEKQETAFSLGLIDFVNENHNPLWFVDSLSDFSRVEN